MKSRLAVFCFLSLLTAAAVGHAPPVEPARPPTGQKVIKDPAEYDAYMKALNLADPAAKAAAFEAFVSAYPGSIVIPDAFREAMAAYQAMGATAKVEAIARRLLVLQPDDLPSLAIMTFLSRAAAGKGDAGALAQVRDFAEHGLRQLSIQQKAEGMSDSDYAVSRARMTAIFQGANGFALLNAKQYPQARAAYLKALEAGSADVSDNYQLGIAEMQMAPLDPNGFWYLARAINLSRAQKNEVGAIAITTFAQRKYQSFHGGIDGWDAIRLRAGASGPIPAGFGATIAHGPTPAEIAVRAVSENGPSSLSFSDWEYVLSYRDASPANAAAAGKVWAAIQAVQRGGAVMIAIPVAVVSASAAGVDASITDDNIASHVADVHILPAEPLETLPAVGAKMVATGVLTSYALQPFRFVMTRARLAPAPGDRSPP